MLSPQRRKDDAEKRREIESETRRKLCVSAVKISFSITFSSLPESETYTRFGFLDC